MNNLSAIVTVTIVFVLLTVLISFALSYPLMLLWNGCLVPALPAIKEVGWLQMWGISILFSFLFKASATTKKD